MQRELDSTVAFQLGYLAAAARLRRQLPAAWREGVITALTREAMEREELCEPEAERQYAPHVRGTRLIVLRCEAAATMLGWRKELPANQRDQLRAAIRKLVAAAQRLGAA